ncbi:MAG: Indole-3-acetyl-aspartic acid hydrolase [Firmicutes bacterium ADurb.Bin182]|nr:MAG: Indole-3-acetyl-aspartic acid hydrolase [Firmicutes bacterium ADurb.Bin182]
MKFDRVDMNALERELVSLRRDIHRYPEAGWTEFRTSALIIDELQKTGLHVRFGESIHVKDEMYGMPCSAALYECEKRAKSESSRADLIKAMHGGITGCIAAIEGGRPGPTVGIRVDIDCNEVEESKGQSHRPFREGFRSEHDNLMHACGHDAHAAIGIGAAKLIHAYKDKLKGKVIIAFQPAEEGVRGAASLTKAGHFSGCDYFFGVHIGLNMTESGSVAASSTGFLASTKMDVIFKGKSSHAGLRPEAGRNALAAAATAALNLLAIPRHSEGASRINVGTLNAGTGRNVIPEKAVMAIETRGSTDEINSYMETSAKRICRSAADMYGCEFEHRFMGKSGTTVCDAPLVEKTMEILRDVEGIKRVVRETDFGCGDDVTTIMKDVRKHGGMATEIVLGTPLSAPHHNGCFDFDEAVIGIGARVLASLAMGVSN